MEQERFYIIHLLGGVVFFDGEANRAVLGDLFSQIYTQVPLLAVLQVPCVIYMINRYLRQVL